MKRTHLIAVVVGVVAMSMFAADASAMYHPTIGRFLQRDPGVGGAVRIGAGGAAPVGGFLPRDPAGTDHYADGMNLYQYARSSPAARRDPSGLLSTSKWVWCTSSQASLLVETDCCSAADAKKIEEAVCRAFNSLMQVTTALNNLEEVIEAGDKGKWTRDHVHTSTQFNRFFYRRPSGATPIADLKKVRAVYDELMDEMDDSDGTHYKCEGKKGKCSSGRAWVEPTWAWTTHICAPFIDGYSDKGRSETVIHELSHMYADPGTSDHSRTYVPTKMDAAGLPVYKRKNTSTGRWDTVTPLSEAKRFTHADTLSEFATRWYHPTP